MSVIPAKFKETPAWKTDKEAAEWLEKSDLSQYNWEGGVPIAEAWATYEAERKEARMMLRLPQVLKSRLEARAKARGTKTQALIREALVKALG